MMAMLTAPMTIQFAFADQPYVAGYGIDGTTVSDIGEAYIRQYFTDEDGNNSIDEDLLSVLSIEGTTGGVSGVSGFNYQGVLQWDIDGYIYTNDQVWGPNQAKTSYGEQDSLIALQMVPKSQFSRATTDIYYNAGQTQVYFDHVIYKTDGTSFGSASVHLKKSWEPTTRFLYGKCTGSACYSGNPSSNTFKFFQFGIETEVTEPTNFKVKQDTIRYKLQGSSSWTNVSSKDAYLTYGDSGNLVGWWFDNTNARRLVTLGGFSFYDAYAKAQLTDGSYSAGIVEWDYTNCGGQRCHTLPQQLW